MHCTSWTLAAIARTLDPDAANLDRLEAGELGLQLVGPRRDKSEAKFAVRVSGGRATSRQARTPDDHRHARNGLAGAVDSQPHEPTCGLREQRGKRTQPQQEHHGQPELHRAPFRPWNVPPTAGCYIRASAPAIRCKPCPRGLAWVPTRSWGS